MGRVRIVFLGLLAVNALSALAGGVGVMINGLSMPPGWLEHSIFPGYFWPGFILVVVVGGTAMAAIAGITWHWMYESVWAIIAGAAMVGWILGEIMIIQQYTWLQPLFGASGLAVGLLGFWLLRQQLLKSVGRTRL